MADKTGISWTQATWNPVVGCSIKSPGCINCYAMGEAHRFGFNPAIQGKYEGLTTLVKGKAIWNGVVRFHPGALDQPLRWKRPRLIFVNSMSDLFHESLSWDAIDKVFAVMALANHHTYQVLTKRSDVMKRYMNDPTTPLRIQAAMRKIGAAQKTKKMPEFKTDYLMHWPLPNVWLGVSVERQEEANERIPDLMTTIAAVRWVSGEPLLGSVNFRKIEVPKEKRDFINGLEYCDALHPNMPGRIDWIVVGGESCKDRKEARPMHPDWARSIRYQCQSAGVPYFFKQHGEWIGVPDLRRLPGGEGPGFGAFDHCPYDMDHESVRVGKKIAGDYLDGRQHHEWPDVR